MTTDTLYIKDKRYADVRFQDGALPHAVGVHAFQVTRANRAHPEESDGHGWTYNHAPMLAYYHGRLYVEYLSDPVSEHEPPGHVLLTSSENGMDWDFPRVVFPSIDAPTAQYLGPRCDALKPVMPTVPHHRMGFFHASNGVMLISTFYGITHDRHLSMPCDGWGVGRAVRRLFPDGSLGDIRFLIYNAPAGYTEDNTPAFSLYRKSADAAFVAACEELLADCAMMRQMYEEQRFDKALFPEESEQALSFYTVNEHEMIGVYKRGLSNLSRDGGRTWSVITKNPTLRTGMGKVWGQRTSDGLFALAYNPTTDSQHRWPIAVVTGADGHAFDGLAAVTGYMSPQRYGGLDKNLGPQYVRGVCERNPQPPDGDMWLTFSNNKEDIWVSRVAVPIKTRETRDAREDFAAMSELPKNWTVYSPLWASVRIEDGALTLLDCDRYDRAAVERALPAASRGVVTVTMSVDARGGCEPCLTLEDDGGRTPVSLSFGEDGMLLVRSGGRAEPWLPYESGRPFTLRIAYDCDACGFSLTYGEQSKSFVFSASVASVARAVIATKRMGQIPYNGIDDNGKYGVREQVLPGCEERTPLTTVRVLSFRSQSSTT